MKAIRHILGVLVMIAGILGLALSLAGLAAVWAAKPAAITYADSTIMVFKDSIAASQSTMQVTSQALGATIDSVDALSTMLGATAASVEDTKPVLDQVYVVMGEKLPNTLEAASNSLKTAQQGAEVLDSAIKSLDAFRTTLSGAPILGTFVEKPEQPYNPEVPLSDSLGAVATNLADLPETFLEMSANLEKADDNLETIQSSLSTMSESVGLISDSLSEYQSMVAQSQASLENLNSMLDSIQNNLPAIMNGVALVFSLFFFWLLAAQVVIFSQGWELYQGTADRIESHEDLSTENATDVTAVDQADEAPEEMTGDSGQ